MTNKRGKGDSRSFASLRMTTFELKITTFEFRMTTFELRITAFEFRITTFELRATTVELRTTTFGLTGLARSKPRRSSGMECLVVVVDAFDAEEAGALA